MAKQLNVNLNIQADTEKAKVRINELVQSLQKVSALPITFGDAGAAELKKASQAAVELQRHLQQAVDVNTGKLDLTRFQTSLTKSNQNLNTLQQTLMSAGTEGQQAFLKLASAIASAQAPATRLNSKLVAMGTTLKNTIKWQISSSLIHGVMGAFSSAVGYAEDLNASLNNIRIVTGKTTDEMAVFANEANRAAKGLSASTLDYTKASLIYYQQGIKDQTEIEERTAVTIKMANVSRQSAEDVSNQMTAIWNNFDDGSKSLEYYADVITALGASTASSSQEIATGLEKFAAVAETVGLSYEYATSALATITATTRQSADVVGTALKTLFARIQDLELGKTLEDGTTLGKYSAALEVVGVNIKDINGEVKDMDVILDELGNKWNQISKDEQIALAQTVAGTRQYTQLMALMDNWDFMKENLEIAEDAEGTLQEQADIYAQSWEAASTRVRNSLERIYSSLVDDRVAVEFLNAIDKILVGIGGLVEGLGGMKGILFTIGSYITSHFAKELPTILSSIAANLVNITSAGERAAIAMQKTAADSLINQFHTHGQNLEFDTQVEGIAKVAQMNAKLIANQKTLSAEEKAYAEIQIENVKLGYEMAATLAKEAQALNEKTKALENNVNVAVNKNDANVLSQNELESDTAALQIQEQQEELLQRHLQLKQQIATATQNGEDTTILERQLARVSAEINRLNTQFNKLQSGANITRTALKNLFSATTQDTTKVNSIVNSLMRSLQGGEKAQSNAMKKINAEIQKLIPKYKEAETAVGAWKEKSDNLGSVNGKTLTESQKSIDEYKQKITELINIVPADNPLRQNIETTLQTITKGNDATTAIEQIKADLNALFNGDFITAKADALREILLALVPPEVREKIIALGQAARESGAGMESLRGSTGGIGPKMEEFAEHNRHVSETLMQMSSVFMSVQSLLNSATRIVDVFNDEDASSIEKVSAILGGLIGLVMAYNSISKITTGIQAALIKAHGANAVAQTAETGATAAQTPVVATNAAAWWAHPIVAIIAAAVMVAVAAFFALSGALKSNTDDLKDNATAAQENYDKTQAQIQANRDLIDSMKELLEQYETDKSKKEELDEVTRKLAEAYGLEGAALAALTGDEGAYQRLLDEAIQHQNQELIEAQEIAAKNKEQQGSYLSGIAASGKGFHNSDPGYYDYTQFEGGGADDEKIAQFLAEKFADNQRVWTATNRANASIGNHWAGVWYDSTNADEVVAAYKTMIEMRDALGKTDLNLKDSGIYKELDAEIKRLQDQVEAYTQASSALAEAEASAAIATAVEKKDIQSYANYETQKQAVIDSLTKKGYSEEAALKAWNNAARTQLDPAIQKYQQLDSVLQDIYSLYNITDTNKKSDIAALFEDSMFNENPQYSTQALAMVDWSQMDELGDKWRPNLEGQAIIADYYLDAKAAALEAANAIETATDAQAKFQKITSSGITADEYKSFETDSGIKWGEDGVIAYSEFLVKTKEEQTQYLEELNQKAKESFIDETQDAISWSEMLLSSYNESLEKAIARGDTNTANHLRGLIAGLEKEIQNKQDELSIYLTLDQKSLLNEIEQVTKQEYKIGAVLELNTVDALRNLGLVISKYLSPNGDGTYTLVVSNFEFKAGVQDAILDRFNLLTSVANQKNEDWYQGVLEHNQDVYGRTITYTQEDKDAMRASIDNGEIYTGASVLSGNDQQLWDAYEAARQAANGDTTGVDFQKELLSEWGEVYDSTDLDATNEALQRVRTSLVELKDAALDNVTTLGELKILNESGIITFDENASKLRELATQYDNCSRELNVYNEALRSGNEELIQTAQAELEAAVAAGEAAKIYGLDASELEDLTDLFGDYNDKLSENENSLTSDAEAAKDAAVRYARLNAAIKDIYDNYDDYEEALKEVKTASTAQDKILASNSKNCLALKKSLAGLIDTSEDFIDINFLDALDPKDLEKAAMGDAKAIAKIRDAFIDAQAAAAGLDLAQYSEAIAQFKEALNSLDEGAIIDIDDWPFLQKLIESQLAAGATATDIESLLSGFGIDANVEPFIGSMQEVADAAAQAANSTAASGDAIVGNMSFDTQTNTVTAKNVDRQEDVGFTEHYTPTTHTVWDKVLEDGESEPKLVQQRVTSWTKTVDTNPIEETADKEQTVTAVKISNAHKSAGGGVSSSNKTTTSPSGGKKGGGGGKTATHKAQTKKTSGENRYHNVEAQIDDLSRVYNKASTAKDRLFGKNRIDAIKQEEAALSKLIAKQQTYLKEIGKYKTKDLNNLLSGVKADEQQGIGAYYTTKDAEGNEYGHYADIKSIKELTGLDLDLSGEGTLLNYEQLSDALINWYNQQVDMFTNASAAEQEKLTNEGFLALAEAQYSAAQELLDQYEETNDKYQEKLEEIRDSLREQQDKRLEEFQYKLELKIKISDNNLKQLEYIRKSLADDKWASVEYLTTLWNNTGDPSEWQEHLQRSADLNAAQEELQTKTYGDVVVDAEGNVISEPDYSQEGYIEELQNLIDQRYEEIDSLWELDDTMCHYYEETLQKGEEELDKYMSRMEDVSSVLEHYKNISELLGKEKNYEWMGTILEGQSSAKLNEMDSARRQFEAAETQYKHMQEEFEKLKVAGVDDATLQKAQAELDAQYDVMVKWQESYLSKTEEYAELQKAIYENMVASISQTMEDAFTGGMGFDRMLDSMEMVSSTQDMILTKTNQIYETNKLMRKLSQDIDKTDSAAAKSKLASFKQEIADMQEKNEMSKFDLEVANARYDLLLAQIALEEAQNAKSTVRLQRDNEGNYGYIYTADEDKVADAEQNVEDKQNGLYNLSLEKANENAQALIQLDQELNDKLNEISLDYTLSEEERQQKMAAVKEEYAQKRARIEKDYLEANFWLNETATDSIYEAWANNYTDIGERLGEYYRDKTGKEGEIKLISAGVAQSFSDEWKTSLGTVTTDTLTWRTTVGTYISEVSAAFEAYKTEMDTKVSPVVGKDLDDLTEKVGLLNTASDTYKTQFDDFVDTNAERLQSISDLTHEYYLQRQELLMLIKTHQDLIKEMNQQIEEATNSTDDTTPTTPPTDEGDESNEPTPTSSSTDTSGTGSLVEFLADVYYGRSGNGTARKQYFKNLGYSDEQIAEYQGVINSFYSQNGWNKSKAWKALKSTYGFDTGGYTGEWGDSGKLAFLHEKELVLNADDTTNLLKTVDLVRALVEAIDLQAISSSMASNMSSPTSGANMQTLQQEVTIHAEFPNATDRNEIEEAFTSLINQATQYAHAKRY